MLIELLWVGVCRAALSLEQNGIENVLIVINYYNLLPEYITTTYKT